MLASCHPTFRAYLSSAVFNYQSSASVPAHKHTLSLSLPRQSAPVRPHAAPSRPAACQMDRSRPSGTKSRPPSGYSGRRRRPSYVTQFINSLREFHATQVQYFPDRVAAGQSPAQRPMRIQSQLLHRDHAFKTNRPSDTSRTAGSNSRSLSEPSAKSVSASRQASGPDDSAPSVQSLRLGRSNPVVAAETTAHPTSELFKQRSPLQAIYTRTDAQGRKRRTLEPVGFVVPLSQLNSSPPPAPRPQPSPDSTSPIAPANSPDVAPPPCPEPADETSESAQQQQRPAPPRPPALRNEAQLVQLQLEQLTRQRERAQLEANSVSPPAKLSGSSSSRTQRGNKIFAQTAKDSTGPSLAQTPAAAVGGSSFAPAQATPRQVAAEQTQDRTQIINGKVVKVDQRAPTISAEQQKKISISRTIADQTPNAIQTLGPGFQISMPGEKSKSEQNKNKGNGHLDAVPSDYEHIYHHASATLVDDIPQAQGRRKAQSSSSPKPKTAPKSGHGAKQQHHINNHQKHKQPQSSLPDRTKKPNLPQLGNKQHKKQEDKKTAKRRTSPGTKKTK